MKELEGVKVKTEGLIYKDKNIPENYSLLYRFAIFCCAADATPVWILVKSHKNNELENETWIQVEGIFQMVLIDGNHLPVISANHIRKKTAPPSQKQYFSQYL